jgi:CheY-like chemotaxis protein
MDDDRILRKLAVRSIGKLAPEWTVREAASGEHALQLTDSESFDVIFADQWIPHGFALLVLELTRRVCRRDPTQKSRFVRVLFQMLSSNSPAVSYEAAWTLVSLSSAPPRLSVRPP